MAKTKRNAMAIEETRLKVKSAMLINRLHDHGMGKIELAQTQVNAIKILLDKSVPNLQAITIGNDPETGPLQVKWVD